MRYVLRRVAVDAPSDEAAADLARRACTVVDCAPDMLLIRATPRSAARIASRLPGWTLAREAFIPVVRHARR